MGAMMRSVSGSPSSSDASHLNDAETHLEDMLTRRAVLATLGVRADGALQVTHAVLEASEVAVAHLCDVETFAHQPVRPITVTGSAEEESARTLIDSLMRLVM